MAPNANSAEQHEAPQLASRQDIERGTAGGAQEPNQRQPMQSKATSKRGSHQQSSGSKRSFAGADIVPSETSVLPPPPPPPLLSGAADSGKRPSRKIEVPERDEGRKRGSLFFDPSGAWFHHWSMVVSLAFLYNFWSLSYRFAFQEISLDTVAFWFALDYSADLVYILDVLFNLRTGYLEDGVLQRNIQKIGQHYRDDIQFYMDCFCLLPLDILYLSIGFNSILRCTRLVKIYKFWQFVDKTERHTNYPNVFRTFTLVHYILVIFHWNACLFHMIAKNRLIDIENLYKMDEKRCDDILCKYLHAFYWSTLALTTIGDLPKPQTKGEYIYVTVELFFGLFLFASVLGHVANIVTNVSAARKEFQAKLDAVKTFMRMRRVSDDLQSKVIRWFDYLWVSQKSSDDDKTVACLPDRLKAEIAIHVHLDTLKRVDIFQNTDAGFLCELVLRLKPVLFSPGDYVCRKGEVGHEMYIVSRGFLEVVTDADKTVVATFKAGSYFGEISVLNLGAAGNKRTASVRSVGYSDLFCLNKQDLWDVLKNYPKEESRIRARAEERLLKLDINQEKRRRSGETPIERDQQHRKQLVATNDDTSCKTGAAGCWGQHRRRVHDSFSSCRPSQRTTCRKCGKLRAEQFCAPRHSSTRTAPPLRAAAGRFGRFQQQALWAENAPADWLAGWREDELADRQAGLDSIAPTKGGELALVGALSVAKAEQRNRLHSISSNTKSLDQTRGGCCEDENDNCDAQVETDLAYTPLASAEIIRQQRRRRQRHRTFCGQLGCNATPLESRGCGGQPADDFATPALAASWRLCATRATSAGSAKRRHTNPEGDGEAAAEDDDDDDDDDGDDCASNDFEEEDDDEGGAYVTRPEHVSARVYRQRVTPPPPLLVAPNEQRQYYVATTTSGPLLEGKSASYNRLDGAPGGVCEQRSSAQPIIQVPVWAAAATRTVGGTTFQYQMLQPMVALQSVSMNHLNVFKPQLAAAPPATRAQTATDGAGDQLRETSTTAPLEAFSSLSSTGRPTCLAEQQELVGCMLSGASELDGQQSAARVCRRRKHQPNLASARRQATATQQRQRRRLQHSQADQLRQHALSADNSLAAATCALPQSGSCEQFAAERAQQQRQSLPDTIVSGCDRLGPSDFCRIDIETGQEGPSSSRAALDKSALNSSPSSPPSSSPKPAAK